MGKKFVLYHTSAQDSENCNFETRLNGLTPCSTTSNYIRQYLRNLYKDKSLNKTCGKMTLVCNAFVGEKETVRSADASFLFSNGSIFTKVIGKCNALPNGDAEVGHIAEFTVIGGSEDFENARGTVTQKIISKNLRELTFKLKL